MYNSIIDFIENDTTKIKKILEKYLFAGNTLRFEEDLMHVMIEFGRKIYQECLKEIEENIRQSEFRKKNYYVEHKADRRTLLTTFGNLEIERAYYKPKNGGKSVYLLDKYVGLAPHDKVSLAIKTKFVEEAVETSYQKGGEKACMTEDVVSKQTVKNTIHELEVELEEEIPVQKKKIKNLHIQADEDLWLEVQQYIYDNYDTEYLENVYIAGDGAPWIVAGCRVLEKSKFVLDKYHLGKYIHKATTHLDDSQQAAKEFIYGAINERDFDGVMRLLQKCYASTDQEYKKKEVTECARYIKNNWLGIMVRIDDGGAVWGCSAEGHISHVLSARESSRPMGWSKKGVDRISRLRVLTRNEQKIIDLMEYQDKKQRKKNRIECEDQLIQNVQKRKSSRNEEVLRKAIPGLEKKQFSWMRSIINAGGTIA